MNPQLQTAAAIIAARCGWDVADTMECVAHHTNSAEPDEATAIAWMEKHADALTEAMHYAAAAYVRDHWTTGSTHEEGKK